VFEQAHGGTLLIDEIGDLDLALQPKLLRAIERSEVRRLGSAQTVKVDVRLLAATRRDLDREVQAGRFRDDLYHRLCVARIELPPLRERAGDVELLARHFFRELGDKATAQLGGFLSRWRDYNWPGNVRELRNAVARQIALGDLGRADEIADEPAAPPPPGAPDIIEEVLALRLPLSLARERVVDNFERRYVARVLAEHGGNVVRAAQASGIARRYLQKLKARQAK
jgi:DNA-binding NtrC family response regulator